MMVMRTALRMLILRGDLRPWALLNDDHENCPRMMIMRGDLRPWTKHI